MKEANLKALSNYLPVNTKAAIFGVPLNSILYLESGDRKVWVTTEKEGLRAYSFYTPLHALLCVLPKHFLQCHKSYVVNLHQAIGIKDRNFIMRNGKMIPISSHYYPYVKLYYCKFLTS